MNASCQKPSMGKSTSDIAKQRHRLPVLIACMMATATAAIEATIIATAMPRIAADLHGAALYSWVFAAYMLTQAVMIPIYGRLADQYGRRRVFTIGTALFLIGSALCGLAPGMTVLIFFRAVQGLGAGAVQPIAYTIVGDIYTPAERARIQGMLSGVFGAAAILGPPLGTFLLETGSWRLIFWINVPISAAAIGMILAFLKENRQGSRHKLDFTGAGLLIFGIGAIVFAADREQQIGLTHAAMIGGLGITSLVALVYQEHRTAEPILPLDLWRNRLIVLVSAGSFTVGAVIMSLIAFLPSFIQAPMGRGADAAGLVLGVMMVVWMLGSITSGQIMVYWPYRVTACAGSLAIMLGAALLLTLTPFSSLGHVIFGASIAGLGLGFCNTSWVVSVQAVVSYEQRGVATSASMFMRFLGQALGVSAAGVVLTTAFHHALPGNPDPLGQLLGDHTLRSSLAGRQLAASVSRCFHGIFVMAELLGVITLIIAAQLPRHLSAGSSKKPSARS